MASDTNDLVLLRIRRLVRCSIRLGYRSACDHPGMLLSGVLLLFLYELCPPSVFAFLVSSSPVFALTALLLGVLLSYGESSVPCWDGGDVLEDHRILSLRSSISLAECSASAEVENVPFEVRLEERIENGKYNGDLNVREGSTDDRGCDPPCEEKMITHIAADDAVLHEEEAYVEEERTPNGKLHGTTCAEKYVSFVPDDTVLGAESCSKYPKSNATMESEERAEEIGEKAELQELDRSYIGTGNNGVHSQYQMGELMRACWQPVMRQDTPCYDSESDLSDDSSSPDASMTDIIPLLEELHPLIDLGTGHPSLAYKNNSHSSSDDDEEEEGVSSENSDEEGEEWQKDDGNDWKDVTGLNSLDMEENSKLENVMELRRTKNILKFELDKKLMDLQAADATRMLKDASSFHVQVPSISTSRQKTFDPSKDSEEMIELPQIPGSAPSLLPRRNLFDLQFDRTMDRRNRFEETWTPRSRFGSAAQNWKRRNSYGQQSSTYLQHHTSVTMENGEISGKHSCDDGHSDNDAEQEGNTGKLFGSLEAHLGEEMKILSAAISDVGVLGEVNHGTDEGSENASVRDNTSSLAGANDNSEPCVVEASSMSEVNSLFKCRMEEVLARSVSEPSVGQPLEVKPEGGLSVSLSSDSWMHASEASSVEVLNFQFARFDEEAATFAASALNNHPDESIRGRSSEALNGHRSGVPVELDGCCRVLLTEGDQKIADMSEERNELLNAGLLEEMNSPFEQLKEDGRSDMSMPRDCELEVDPVELNTGLLVIDADTDGDASEQRFRTN
ncbi:uncharacterized protein LOC100832179 [Brachypodium distachyon]|uniref:Uncharacterized protein n=1 Tax=Brachypodium distachyon TaxID=15368 RepID=I1INQ6_BRADI|nr:uncharacterized protein LOC100832179 [Brachypodium distachyon]KQJ89528.1 hypothetical protein BRADI_4g26250v3 [Brachypodium distachyon]|eukprot:XP_014758865.1 uncharacterized protein LOC100832179 [Brachypodium distachyon]